VRLAYLGTPAAAVAPLDALVSAGHEVVQVITRPDARRSRRSGPEPSPVRVAAERLGIPVGFDPEQLIAPASTGGIELGVVVAYGRLIRPPVLAALEMVNLHFSLLPRWRGAAPVERALMAGDERTGVCLMRLDEGLDTGPVHACVEVSIESDDTAEALRDRLVQVGCELLVTQLREGLGEPAPQLGEPTHADKVTPADLHLDWSLPADYLERLVRVGGAWTTLRGSRVKVHTAEVIDGRLRPVVVQPEGKRPMAFEDFARGARLADDEWFQ